MDKAEYIFNKLAQFYEDDREFTPFEIPEEGDIKSKGFKPVALANGDLVVAKGNKYYRYNPRSKVMKRMTDMEVERDLTLQNISRYISLENPYG